MVVHKDYRNKGIGNNLFFEVQKSIADKEISIINVHNNDFDSISFLTKIGLKLTLEQYEMKI